MVDKFPDVIAVKREIMLDKLAQVVLGTGETAIYTAPTGTDKYGEINALVICNTNSSDRTFTLYQYASGGSAADSNALYKTMTIRGNRSIMLGPEQIKWVLRNGSKLTGLASAVTSITVTAYGGERR